MSEGESQKSFWATVPGLLTGVASLLTALVALMSCLASQKPKHDAGTTEVAVQTANLSSCGEVVGT